MASGATATSSASIGQTPRWRPAAWAALRAPLQAWWERRHPRTDRWALTQRSLYIVPTGAGWLYALLLVSLLLGSINYQLNLGYLLTFVLASAGAVAIHATHATLRGLVVSLRCDGPMPPRAHVGQTLELPVLLTDNIRRSRLGRWFFMGRHGIALRWSAPAAGLALDDPASGALWVDVATGGTSQARLGHTPRQRGLQHLPSLRIETRFPLGLLRAWSVWRPALEILIWPSIEVDAPPLPLPGADGGEPPETTPPPASRRARSIEPPEADGVRAWRHGDSPSQVLWRLSARQLDSGGELLVRDHGPAPQPARVLAWSHTATLGDDAEARLSRLCAWVLSADRAGLRTTLRLPSQLVPEGSGAAHRLACLDALALAASPGGSATRTSL